MWLEGTLENRKNLRKAFIELGYGDYSALETIQFIPRFSIFSIGDGIELDIVTEITDVKQFPNDQMNPLFEATVQSVEEAIVNALVAADTMEGVNGNKAYALPHDKVIALLKKYNRIK